jgi:hypothetical protein
MLDGEVQALSPFSTEPLTPTELVPTVGPKLKPSA